MYVIGVSYSQKVQQEYNKWSADTTTLGIFIEDNPSPVIKLDQQEQKVDQWKILPLSSPTQVRSNQGFNMLFDMHNLPDF